ncbi:MAG: LON peptidase substrate-binding domain-containing protein [Ignavibacteria bacterium]|nr:LON peptidase substrate-binding domain-containing protein [Ignavibacteria bacterium]
MSDVTEIALFPLNVVLFPYSKLPLYIFEERYKKMINDCLVNEKIFGINFFADKKIHLTGCTASVEEILNRTETGELNITVKGRRRYKILNYELGIDGYYIGTIEYTEDVIDPVFDKAGMEKAVKHYNDLVELVYKGKVMKIDLNETRWNDGSRSLAFAMAEKCGLNLTERQSLLEADSENKRLDQILKYFDEVMPKIKEADKINNIIKSDGYIQQ